MTLDGGGWTLIVKNWYDQNLGGIADARGVVTDALTHKPITAPPKREAEETSVDSVCPYCGVGCNLQLHVKGDYIFKVTSPFDGVVNQGNLCVKGRFGYDYIYHPRRITMPLVRKQAQKPGARTQAFDPSGWEQVSWEQALDLVADRLIEIYHRDGSDALATYLCAKATNEDNYLLQKVFRSLFRTNNIDHCARL